MQLDPRNGISIAFAVVRAQMRAELTRREHCLGCPKDRLWSTDRCNRRRSNNLADVREWHRTDLSITRANAALAAIDVEIHTAFPFGTQEV